VVVDAGDAVLVCRRDRAQDVRQAVEELSRRGREEVL
jgi:mannose-1-phosphate guanylyltransferase